MSKKLENDVRMAKTFHEVLNTYRHLWGDNKGFKQEVNESVELMEQMKQSRVLAQQRSQGSTKTKADLKEKVVALCMSISGCALVYAKKKNDLELEQQLDYSATRLKRMAGNKLAAKLQYVYDVFKKSGDSLNDYDVTPEQIELFGEMIEAYAAMIPKPRTVQVAVKNQHRSTKELMELIKKSFYNMDRLMANINNKDFESEYKSARIIIGLGSRHEKPKEENDNNKEQEA
ncbi:hypothetical protein F0919_01955 [Taibaiella lutea]|uniref:Uncharacterized protein n=1 Tax=Taibaiella lutea TaxID=2608001 RepID=A0A5M6CMT7_9BACT|nr:hypothetical protein [Taibaiella lutea]KAA5536454.1 hypothetical protein F0919_01955 [Taibaiella lutea]